MLLMLCPKSGENLVRNASEDQASNMVDFKGLHKAGEESSERLMKREQEGELEEEWGRRLKGGDGERVGDRL